MAVVIWSPQARADLAAIEEYYVEIAPQYADIVVEGLLGSVRRLESFPLSGRAVLRSMIRRSERSSGGSTA